MEYVLITGASSGVGKELAIRLSEHYPLILNGRNIDRLEDTRKKCKQEALVWAQGDVFAADRLCGDHLPGGNTVPLSAGADRHFSLGADRGLDQASVLHRHLS